MTKYDLEREVLGLLLLQFEEKADLFLARLSVEDFSDKRHQTIYQMAQTLVRANVMEFDLSYVTTTYPNSIKRMGGIQYITSLYSDIITKKKMGLVIDSLLKVNVLDKIDNLPKVVRPMFNESFEKGIGLVQAQLEDILDFSNKVESVNLFDNFKKQLKGETIVRADLGFPSLHKVMGFPHPGELLVLGARPGMGKTAIALEFLFNYVHSENAKRAVMFSLEMKGSELFNRMISTVSGVPLSHIRAGEINDKSRATLEKNAKVLHDKKNMVLYDSTVTTTNGIRAALRKESRKGEIGLVIVDYLQLLTGPGNSNYERVSEISRQMKLIARDFNCTVIALSQLSRKVEERKDKRPLLSDLRESGAIEQDADYVLFLYREAYYNQPSNFDPKHDIVEVDIAKNRHGANGVVPLDFDLTIGKFSEQKEVK